MWNQHCKSYNLILSHRKHDCIKLLHSFFLSSCTIEGGSNSLSLHEYPLACCCSLVELSPHHATRNPCSLFVSPLKEVFLIANTLKHLLALLLIFQHKILVVQHYRLSNAKLYLREYLAAFEWKTPCILVKPSSISILLNQ